MILTSNKLLGPGVHLVIVHSIKWARGFDGQVKKTKLGEPAIDIIYKDGKNKQVTGTYWITENAKWVIDALCKAIGISNEKNVPAVDEVVGKRLFILVANEYLISEDARVKNEDGTDKCVPVVLTKFYPVVDPLNKPMIEGDPECNNGIPSGIFVKERMMI